MESSTAAESKRRVSRGGLARVAALVALALIGAGLGYLRTWPPVATVMSASMSPTIDTGDVVVMRKLQHAPRKGDVIAVSVPDAARSRYGYPPKVIHRVVAVAPDGRITTKGDARKKPDPFRVPRSSVTTEVAFTLPAAGRVLAFLGSTLGLIWLASGALFLVVLPLLERQRDAAVRERSDMEALRGDVDALRSDLQAVLEEVVRAQSSGGPAQAAVEERIAELSEATLATQAQVAAARAELAELVDAALGEEQPVAGTIGAEQIEPGTTYLRLAEPEPEWGPVEPWTNVFLPERRPRPMALPHVAPTRVRTRSGGLLGLIERRAR